MFTIRPYIVHSFFKGDSPSAAPAPTGESNYDQLKKLNTPKERADFIKRLELQNEQDKTMLFASLDAEIQAGKDNEGRDAIELTTIRKSWEEAYANLDAKKSAESQVVQTGTKKETKTLSDMYQTQKTEAKKDEATGLERNGKGEITVESMKKILGDFDGNGEVESKNTSWFSRAILNKGEQKYIVGERQFVETVADLDKAQLDALAKRINATIPWTSNLDSISIHRDTQIKDFRQKVIEQATALNIVGKVILGDSKASTGLMSLVNGTDAELLNVLTTDKDKINAVQELVQNRKGLGETIVSALLKIGIMLPVTVLSHGLAMGYIESREIDVDGEKGGLRLKKGVGESGSVVASIDLAGAKIEGNWNDPSQRIIGRTHKFLSALKGGITADIVTKAVDENIASASKDSFSASEKPQIDSVSSDYKKLQSDIMTKLAGKTLDANSQKILLEQLTQNALVYNGKVEEVKGIQSKGLFAALGLNGVAIGLSGSKVNTSATLDANANAAVAEAGVNQFVLTPEKKMALLNRGDMSYSIENGIEKLVVKNVKMTPDFLELQKSRHLVLSEDGKTATVTTKPGEKLSSRPADIILSDGSHITYYRFTIAGKNDIPTATPISQQEKNQVRNALENREVVQGVGDMIYTMSRNKAKYPGFDKALVAIGQQDYASAMTHLESMKDNAVAKLLIDKFKNNPAGLAVVNTFTYGATGVMKSKAVDAKSYAIARKDTLAAENKLGNATSPDLEKQFSDVKKHIPVNLSELYAGQGLAVSVYATPKGGTHRIDRYEGSVQVSDKVVEITDTKSQDFVLQTHKKTTESQLRIMNAYLPKGKQLDRAAYESIIKTGTLPKSLTDAGYGLQAKPHILEARAMIKGNICANKTEVIAYPLLKEQPVQSVVNNEDMFGVGTVLANTKVSQTDIGGGIGVTTGDNSKKSEQTDEPSNPTTNPTPNPKDGGGMSQINNGQQTVGNASQSSVAVNVGASTNNVVAPVAQVPVATNAVSGRGAAAVKPQ